MTRRILCLLFFMFVWSGRAFAVEAVVRSGEHGSFTRLVVDLPQTSAWELNQNGSEARLRIARGVTGFDLSQVFSRIDQSRLGSLREGENRGELLLDLACDCSARAFLVGSNMLVIDIAARTDQPLPGSSRQSSEPERSGIGAPTIDGQAVDLPLFLPAAGAEQAGPVSWPPLSPHVDLQTTKALEAAEDRLLRQIGRAATQGLLEPRVAPFGTEHSGSASAASSQTQPATRETDPEPTIETVPLRAITSRDHALLDHVRLDGQELTDTACLPDADFAIAEWGAEDFATGLADWRSRLYGEFDKIDAEAAMGLARFYLHFGFGAEARRSLALHDRPYPVLSVLSHILDGDPVYDAGPFLAQGTCNGAVALWAVLALPDKEGRIDINHQSVVRYFTSLPRHLRDRLGPELARRLSLFKYGEAADIVMRRLDLVPQVASAEKAMAEAQIAEEKGAIDLAQAARQGVVAEGSVQSPSALADMIAGELAAGRPIMPELADLAAAYAYERRGDPDAVRFAWAAIQARAGAGQFNQAFQSLEALDDAAKDELRPDSIYDLVRSRTDDADFLTLLLPRLEQASALSPRSANLLAERLLDLGFPKEAASILRMGASGPEGRARRLLRAGIALDLGDPRQAEAEILGLEGSDIDELRQRARDMARDRAVADSMFSPSTEAENTAQTAFAPDASAQQADADDPVADALLRLSQPQVADMPEPEQALARNRALLNRSAETRQILDQLLTTYPPVSALPANGEAQSR